MVDANVKDEASKSKSSHGEDAIEKDEALLKSLNTMEEEEDIDDEEDEYDEEEVEEDDDDDDDEEQPEEEKLNDGENAVIVINNEEKLETVKEKAVKKDAKNGEEPKPKSDKKSGDNSKSKEKRPTNKSRTEDGQNGDNPESSRRKKVSKRVEKLNDGENAVIVINNEEKLETVKEKAVKKDAKKGEEPKPKPKSDKKSGDNSKSKEKRPTNKSRTKDEQNGDNPESSRRKKASKRVETMGMVFMCSSKTKADCFRYKILGLPETKKDQVLKIYRGMRLFLFDVDLRLMYGIFKAAGPGGYNIEPKAFKSEFPSQVRFTVLDDCLPLAEENFKHVLKENYYSRNKFESLLKSDQVKKLCKLFKEMGRGGSRSRSAAKSRRTRPVEPRRARPDETRRTRPDDRRASRAEEKLKRWDRDEDRRPRSRSPLAREKRWYTDFDRPPVIYDREPAVVYDREPPVSRYRPPQPVVGSPVRLYTYEREPLDIPSYVRDRVPEPPTYRVVDRDQDQDHTPEPHTYRVVDRVIDRDHVPEPHTYCVVDRNREWERDPYLAYGREPPPPLYHDTVYTVPPSEFHLVSREYHHPPAIEIPSEYHVSGGSRVASYRDEIASDYRPAVGLPEYRSRTHYKY